MNKINKCVAFILLLTALILANTIGSLIRGEADVTENRLYTLSARTVTMLDEVEEPVTLRFYYSRSVASAPIQFKNYAARVQDLLRQYEKVSRGRVRLEVINPRPDTREEEAAVRAGIAAEPLPTGETLFFGLLAIQADQERVIPVFSRHRQDFLEYDISRIIHQVQQLDPPKVGIVSSLEMFGDEAAGKSGESGSGWAFIDELRENFDVRPIRGDRIPAGLDVLAVIHPQELSGSLLFQIDQFLLSGKPVFVAVDPSSYLQKDREDRIRMQETLLAGERLPITSDLPDLFKEWGIEYNDQTVVGDMDLAASATGAGGQVIRYSVWLAVEEFNKNSPPTAQLSQVLLPEPGSFALSGDSGLELTPLIKVSDKSGVIGTAVLSQASPDVVNRTLDPDGAEKVIAGIIRGEFKTAFSAGSGETQPSIRSGRGTLFLVADTDFLADQFSARQLGNQGRVPINDNLAFANNAIEFLAGSDGLIGLRSKGSTLRPFDRVRRMEAAAQKTYVDRLNVLEERLEEIREELREIEGRQRGREQLVASPEVRKAIEEFQAEEDELRAEHRQIRKKLREDIEKLKLNLVLLNLLTMPILVGLFGVNFFIIRTKRQKR